MCMVIDIAAVLKDKSLFFFSRQNQERELLQKRHKEEIEEFMQKHGISISTTPINLTMPTVSGSLSNAQMLSPMTMSTIPNPPPLPASMMSLSVAKDFPIFSVARSQQNMSKGAHTFAEELYKYVSARNQAALAQQTGLAQPDMNAIDSETVSTSQGVETLASESISDLDSIEQESELALSQSDTKTRLPSVESADDSASTLLPQQQMTSPIQEGIMPNPAFIMQQPMYNLYTSPSGQYLQMPSHHLQIVEAGLLPHYQTLMSVANSVAVTTTTTTGSTSPTPVERDQTDS